MRSLIGLITFILLMGCCNLINKEDEGLSNSEKCLLSYLICTGGEIRDEPLCSRPSGYVAQACLGNSL
jgi:hypothetical protein